MLTTMVNGFEWRKTFSQYAAHHFLVITIINQINTKMVQYNLKLIL